MERYCSYLSSLVSDNVPDFACLELEETRDPRMRHGRPYSLLEVVHQVLQELISRIEDVERLGLDVFFCILSRCRLHHLALTHPVRAPEGRTEEHQAPYSLQDAGPLLPVVVRIAYCLLSLSARVGPPVYKPTLRTTSPPKLCATNISGRSTQFFSRQSAIKVHNLDSEALLVPTFRSRLNA
jgi:hypothetical protein